MRKEGVEVVLKGRLTRGYEIGVAVAEVLLRRELGDTSCRSRDR